MDDKKACYVACITSNPYHRIQRKVGWVNLVFLGIAEKDASVVLSNSLIYGGYKEEKGDGTSKTNGYILLVYTLTHTRKQHDFINNGKERARIAFQSH